MVAVGSPDDGWPGCPDTKIAFQKTVFIVLGIFFTIFIITIAAAEAAVAIAIIINLYRSHKSIDVEDATEMKY